MQLTDATSRSSPRHRCGDRIPALRDGSAARPEVEARGRELAGGVVPDSLDVQVDPGGLGKIADAVVTQSGFHGRECAGSLETRKAEGARVTPTAASAVVVSSRVSWMRAHVTESMAMCRSWCVLVSFRSFWPALTTLAVWRIRQDSGRSTPSARRPRTRRTGCCG